MDNVNLTAFTKRFVEDSCQINFVNTNNFIFPIHKLISML